jgi:hypothetical protein
MDERSLEKNLANIERELLNLQTAHDVGLGSVRFYEYMGSEAATNVIRLRITVQDGERSWPFMVVMMERENDWRAEYNILVPANNDGTEFIAQVGALLDDVVTNWKIVSTSRLSVVREI